MFANYAIVVVKYNSIHADEYTYSNYIMKHHLNTRLEVFASSYDSMLMGWSKDTHGMRQDEGSLCAVSRLFGNISLSIVGIPTHGMMLFARD